MTLEGVVRHPPEMAQRYRDAGYWTDETFGAMLAARAAAHPDRIALVGDGKRWTYRELDERADRLANGLLAGGLRAGDCPRPPTSRCTGC